MVTCFGTLATYNGRLLGRMVGLGYYSVIGCRSWNVPGEIIQLKGINYLGDGYRVLRKRCLQLRLLVRLYHPQFSAIVKKKMTSRLRFGEKEVRLLVMELLKRHSFDFGDMIKSGDTILENCRHIVKALIAFAMEERGT